MKRLLLISLAVLAALCVGTTDARAVCGIRSYGYAGMGTRTVARGVAATITANASATVHDGHVAGWVGVGGVGAGPGGADEWLQIGLSAFPLDVKSRIYYENGKALYRLPDYGHLKDAPFAPRTSVEFAGHEDIFDAIRQQVETAQRGGDYAKASKLQYSEVPAIEKQIDEEKDSRRKRE